MRATVVAQDGGGFVYAGEGGGGLGGELTGAMAGLAGRRDPPVPVVAVTPPQDAYQLFVQLGPDVVYAGAAGAGNAEAAAGLGWLGAAKAAKVAAEGFAGRPPAAAGGFAAVVSAVRAAGPGARAVVSFLELGGLRERVVEAGADGRGQVVFWDGHARALAVLPGSPATVRFVLTAGTGLLQVGQVSAGIRQPVSPGNLSLIRLLRTNTGTDAERREARRRAEAELRGNRARAGGGGGSGWPARYPGGLGQAVGCQRLEPARRASGLRAGAGCACWPGGGGDGAGVGVAGGGRG